MSADARLRIGFIPLADATALIIAVDKGFTAAEGLDVELVREVSWSNVRDKLNIGLFDAAHLIAPVAIASSLGHRPRQGADRRAVRARRERQCHHGVAGALCRDAARRPTASSPTRWCRRARSPRVVAKRKAKGEEPLTFGMTFPFSTHNYHLRFWMAAGGVDPDEDVRLVVLPPPYMVESLANKHVDGFCVGAPWNSVAVDLGIGFILHFVSEILPRAAEKLLAVRGRWAEEKPDDAARLVRAHGRAADFVEDLANREEVSAILAAPNRIGVAPEVIRRTLDGRMKVAPDGTVRNNDRYLLVGRKGAARPDPVQAAWLYAQMVRWGQAPLSAELLATAKAVFRPDLYDAALADKNATLQVSRPTGSARSPGRHSTPTISPAIWRRGTSSDEQGGSA